MGLNRGVRHDAEDPDIGKGGSGCSRGSPAAVLRLRITVR